MLLCNENMNKLPCGATLLFLRISFTNRLAQDKLTLGIHLHGNGLHYSSAPWFGDSQSDNSVLKVNKAFCGKNSTYSNDTL